MTDELKPVRCGCGGEALTHTLGNEIAKGYYIACDECGTKTRVFGYEAEAIETWNMVMGEQTAKSDLISRNDAVEAIEFKKVYMTAYKGNSIGYVNEGNPLKQYNKGLDDAIKAVNSLAPAEPERKWIPVTEALPDDMDRVLVTIVRSDGSKRVRSGHYYKGYFMLDNGDTWNATDKEVLAWMPLPEPYGGE